jgi:hypothetical protein
MASSAFGESAAGHGTAGEQSHVADHLGGTDGNEVLTSATAVVLTVLLAVEGITILQMRSLVSVHMFIGMVLIPPIALKLGSTGYRFVRYYTGSRAYREKGPPALPLRLLAPVLVVTTIAIFVTGVWLMLLGHRSDQLLFFHKLSFFIWGGLFVIHFLWYAPWMARSLRRDWSAAGRRAIPGSGWRGMLVAASLGGGLALAVALLSVIDGWHGRHPLL